MMKYEKNDHTIYHGDAMDVLRKEISDESVDLVCVDPPYNIGKKFSSFYDKWSSDSEYTKWAYQCIDECIRNLKSTGSLNTEDKMGDIFSVSYQA